MTSPTKPLAQQQQQADPTQRDPQSRQQQMGEGSYEATRDYQKSVKGYLDRADVAADAKAAKPKNAEEAKELERAEREGRSHAKTGQPVDRI